jgi:hypothetical protein
VLISPAMHIGQAIRKRMHELGKSVVCFSRELPCSRANVYLIFEKSTIDTELLMRISILLDYDFFALYSKEMKDRKR